MANQSWRWQRKRQRVSEAMVVSELSKSDCATTQVTNQAKQPKPHILKKERKKVD
ncbi:hypothetical protein YC2023_096170 [Brassica napus]